MGFQIPARHKFGRDLHNRYSSPTPYTLSPKPSTQDRENASPNLGGAHAISLLTNANKKDATGVGLGFRVQGSIGVHAKKR